MQNLNSAQHEFDVCIVGGGMAGMCAAIAAARHGAKTAIVHDRPVFGGNASSEVRMWICGAHGPHNKETGILEEIQLENQYRNPTGNYSIWDSVLYGKIFFQPNLTTFLNCSCTEAEMDGTKIVAIKAWQSPSQTWHTIHAKYFIDCSGDSILAATTGAEFRVGREAASEFNEDIEPAQADRKTMGNSLLIQIRETATPQPYIPPAWAYKFTSPNDFPYRLHGVDGHNFWWIEVGGLQDTIGDAETIRDELMRITYGVWDYIKNHAPERAKAENWAIEWIGAVPGKRENRRFIGDHTLTQNDIRAGGAFSDMVGYGGWTMDDHHPAGIYYPGKPTIFHPAPSPYGIPYRSLYSRNIANLLFAGRNISVTHAALSSTRVMGTCSILGQAVGTAAALCLKHRCSPRTVPLVELQQTLLDDDCWLPGVTRPLSDLAHTGKLTGDGQDLPLLLDGMDRDRPDRKHAWSGRHAEYHWNSPQKLAGVRLVFDSNLQLHKRMPCTFPHKTTMPGTLVKSYRLETETGTVFRETNNHQRLVRVPLRSTAKTLRLVIEETWGQTDARVFSFEPVTALNPLPRYPDGPHFSEVCAKIARADLAPPAAEAADTKRSRFSA
ncbi:MAG: hypothetical protein PCFJNLEI_02874 [Verrucomicrobiae bacterium]|nr:hypothetical protein [Verrucomicrobiae bacterium]